MEKLKKDENVSREIAFEIMKESNTAYNAYYKIKEEESDKLSKRPVNAYKDFIL